METKSKIQRFILVGPGGAGKNYLLTRFISKGYEYQVSYTTRAPRSDEKHGTDYFFISEQEFEEMTKKDLWYEKAQFGKFQYGTTKTQFFTPTPSVFIMSAQGLRHLPVVDRQSSFVIFLNPEKKILQERLEKRGWSPEMISKRQKDDLQFDRWDQGTPGMMVTDPWFDADSIVASLQIN